MATTNTTKTAPEQMNAAQLIDILADKIKQAERPVMTLPQAAEYLGVAKSFVYRLTQEKRIPYYKPSGKTIFFKREELDAWIFAARIASEDENQATAAQYAM